MVDKARSEVEPVWSFKAISTKGIDALANRLHIDSGRCKLGLYGTTVTLFLIEPRLLRAMDSQDPY